MTVYVDDFRALATVNGTRGRWSHLVADEEAELHAFAERLGLRRSWFQDPRVPRPGHRPAVTGSYHAESWHYDVVEAKRRAAIELGAVAIGWDEVPDVVHRRLARRAARETGDA